MVLIYSRIKELAALKGVKMPAVAEKAGVSVGTIKNWNKSVPTVMALLSVAEYFGVSVDYLIGHSDNPLSHKSAGPVSRSLIQALEQLSIATQEVQDKLAENLTPQEEPNANIEETTLDENQN